MPGGKLVSHQPLAPGEAGGVSEASPDLGPTCRLDKVRNLGLDRITPRSGAQPNHGSASGRPRGKESWRTRTGRRSVKTPEPMNGGGTLVAPSLVPARLGCEGSGAPPVETEAAA